jgi:glycerophosphoryl diester phosphodiesterase
LIPQVHGHRGARARWPENTVPGFEYAIGLGIDAIEFDVFVTAVGRLLITHDPVETETTLDQVLSLPGSFAFDLEIKSYPHLTPMGFAEPVLEAIRRHKVEARVNLFSFDWRILHAMRELAPDIRCAALYEGEPRSFLEIARAAGNTTVVCPHYTLVTSERVAEAHAAGLEIYTWTANTEADWNRLVAAQVDAIITDDPAALLAYLHSLRSVTLGSSPAARLAGT